MAPSLPNLTERWRISPRWILAVARWLWLLAILVAVLSPTATAVEPSAADANFFETSVRPLLVARCLNCHADKSPKGGVRLNSREGILKGGDTGPAAVVNKPDESLIIRAVRYVDEPKMPPSGKLTEREANILERWVAMGIPWPSAKATAPPASAATIPAAPAPAQPPFWSFQPLVASPTSRVKNAAWIRSSIDRFILAALEARGLTPAPPASKRTLIRRATFDLTGLPPTPEEVEAFLADKSPRAFDRVVDRLLASPSYGERWGRHWLDIVRYADARDLIQLPPESDFRESWRYRDWVIAAFNRDLPYTEFVRNQIAGDLLPASSAADVNADGLVATGMLAIADFVPGDVDKDQMIADYVNDEVDVVGRAFLGLTLACARCHDHKFDPISIEDYYALAGIFFSTRVIPGPVPGNTPLIRTPLISQAEIASIEADNAATAERRSTLEQQLPDAVDRAFNRSLSQTVAAQTARHLVAAVELRGPHSRSVRDVAKKHGLDERKLANWAAYLDRVAAQPLISRHSAIKGAASGTLTGAALDRAARQLEQDLASFAAKQQADRLSKNQALARSSLIHLRANDPYLLTDSSGRVTLWPNRSGLPLDAAPPKSGRGPLRARVEINGHLRTVLRFDGQSLLESPRKAPATGSLFIVYRGDQSSSSGQRLLGWEDSDTGRHGLGLMTEAGNGLRAILRDNGRSGDLVDSPAPDGFAIAALTWGPGGTMLHRNGKMRASQEIKGISSDPGIAALRLGGPGSGSSPMFRGDIAEVRVYDRPLTEAERMAVEAELHDTWLANGKTPAPGRDLLGELYEELLSPRGPFWVASSERETKLAPVEKADLSNLRTELAGLKARPARQIPRAVTVQDGGPPGTRHEGFKDAQVYLRGDPKRPGKTVPRGVPRVLAARLPASPIVGSGRRQLADWLVRPDHPLTARVMVNRIWQHHFGEGLVRSPNDFGTRGERPTHPELLDDLALQFIATGWSVKSMHKLIMTSSVYQQSSRTNPDSISVDPENRLWSRMNRRRLEAESIRDSLLSVSGQLDRTAGGPAFSEPALFRRTLYLQSARTGASTSDFNRLFDSADPGSIVAVRGQSIVAPQALFFLNDPFVADLASALATRLEKDEPNGGDLRINRLYQLALGRPPTRDELALGRELTASGNAWHRYCQVIFSLNEFIYID